jgi:hypothetical protein
MKVAPCAIAAVLAAGIAGGIGWWRCALEAAQSGRALRDAAVAAVGRQLDIRQQRLVTDLGELARSIAADQEFALKLLVENDRSSPAIAGTAGRYIGPMGLAFLEIADSTGIVLSSGHFPAAAGNRSWLSAAAPESAAAFVLCPNGAGDSLLLLAARFRFSIEGAALQCIGGIAVDQAFCRSLWPGGRSRLLLRRNATVMAACGMEMPDGTPIAIDRRRFLVDSLALSARDGSGGPALIVMIDRRMH